MMNYMVLGTLSGMLFRWNKCSTYLYGDIFLQNISVVNLCITKIIVFKCRFFNLGDLYLKVLCSGCATVVRYFIEWRSCMCIFIWHEKIKAELENGAKLVGVSPL